ncbi:MAG: 6-phosphofructokinase 1 [Thermoproteota archaeon]|nr:6-phosphofructokinase 1 [Thermoproteota archaeon]
MRIGVTTTGGDAPGMNAAIRAVVRYAIPQGLEVVGIERGYAGLITNQIIPLNLRSVGGILHLGGTFLKSARCPEFKTPEGIKRSVEVLIENKIDGLVVIGGDGSFRGAMDLSKASGISIIGIPATIDNDVAGTDSTIGFDTAVNTALDAIDKIRDTALSHERIFVVEVMGRNRGFLALEVGLAGGAGVILIPEIKFKLDTMCKRLRVYEESGKASTIIVAAEGIGDTAAVVNYIEKNTKYEVRFTKLGHIQRGGSPTARSRLLADLFAAKAVELLLQGAKDKMVGLKGNSVISVDFNYACNAKKPLDKRLYKLAEDLAV